jgi:hypothetical protein
VAVVLTAAFAVVELPGVCGSKLYPLVGVPFGAIVPGRLNRPGTAARYARWDGEPAKDILPLRATRNRHRRMVSHRA